MNLIITCQRNLEDPTMLEIQNILERLGDSKSVVQKTVFSGIIEVETELEIMQVLQDFRKIIDDEPWLIKYCSRLIPIEETCESKLDEIKNKIVSLSDKIKKNDKQS